jgi:hypothetical protein
MHVLWALWEPENLFLDHFSPDIKKNISLLPIVMMEIDGNYGGVILLLLLDLNYEYDDIDTFLDLLLFKRDIFDSGIPFCVALGFSMRGLYKDTTSIH